MKKNIYPILFFISLIFYSCSSENDDNNQDRVEEKLVLNQNEKMEAVYYSIPSPMETTIILKRNYPKFSANLLFPDINIHEIHDNQIRALILGIISTDLNYAMLSERKLETNRLINKVIEIAQILHLDGVVNSSIKDRIEKVGGITQKIDQRTSNILVRLESNTDEVGSIDKRIEIMADHIKIMTDLLKQMEQEQRVRNLVKMAHGENTIPPK